MRVSVSFSCLGSAIAAAVPLEGNAAASFRYLDHDYMHPDVDIASVAGGKVPMDPKGLDAMGEELSKRMKARMAVAISSSLSNELGVVARVEVAVCPRRGRGCYAGMSSTHPSASSLRAGGREGAGVAGSLA